MQPGTDEQMLLAAGIRSAAMLPPDIAVDRADAHEVIPASDREGRHIHIGEAARTVFLLPIFVINRMLEDRLHPPASIRRIPSILHEIAKPLRTRGASDPIALMKQAQPGIPHVLRNEVRRLRDG